MIDVLLLLMAQMATLAGPSTASKPVDHIFYIVHGLTGSIEYMVDLRTGAVTLDEQSFPIDPATRPRGAQAKSEELAVFRSEAKRVVAEGGETEDCVRLERQDPEAVRTAPMDYRPHLAVTFEGRYADTPANPSCWSAAAKTLETHLSHFAGKQAKEG